MAGLSSALQGLSPGLNISHSGGKENEIANINIRGFTSINGGSPLVIIDGVEGNINFINPKDIESISVLKDAGSAAIYGARGAFGVVLIETKQAKKGRVSVHFSSSLNFMSPTVNTDYLKDPYRAAKLADDSFRAIIGRSYTGYTEEDYEELKKVSQNPSLARVIIANRKGKKQYVHYGATDWWNYFFKKARPSYINTISVTGGSENIKSYLAYRNFSSEGILKVQEDTYKKDNLRAKVEIDLSDFVTVSSNYQYYNSKDLAHGGSQYGYEDLWTGNMRIHALPSYVPTNPDGTFLWKTGLNPYAVGNGTYAALLQGKSKKETNQSELSLINEIKISPIDGLHIKANYAFREMKVEQIIRSTKVPYSTYAGEINTFGKNKIVVNNQKNNYNSWNIYGEYSKKIEDHYLSGVIGFNRESYLKNGVSSSKQDLISDDLNNVNLASSSPEVSGNAHEWALQGYFLRLSYNYDDKYLMEFNGRYDGTSKFPKNSQWNFFPSFSLGWNLNREDFFRKTIPWASTFKLRSSYGFLGNQNIEPYSYVPILRKGVDSGFDMEGNKLDYVSAPNLIPTRATWEKVRTFNLGTDIGIYRNRFMLHFDWFQRDVIGMLAKGKTQPAVLGAKPPQENSADLMTQGFELTLKYSHKFNLINSDFNFNIYAGISDSKTIITKFDNPKKNLTDYYEGMTLGEIWGYSVDGLFKTEEEIKKHANQVRVSSLISSRGGGLQPGDVKFRDINNDGYVNEGDNTAINPGDRSIIGNASPRYQYNFGLSLDWKGFDFSTFFQGVGKQDWYPYTDEKMFWGIYNRPYNIYIRKDLANNIWSPENPNAYYPRLVGYTSIYRTSQLGVVNDRYLQDISYLRLKTISLGYSLPKNLLKKLHLNKLRIFLSGENLITFTKLTSYIDPEAASRGFSFDKPWAGDRRWRSQSHPFSKIYSVGIQLNF